MTAATSITFVHTLVALLHASTKDVTAATSAACFAVQRRKGGNGFGTSKSKSVATTPPSQDKKKKVKPGLLLEELKPRAPPSGETSTAVTSPKLDRFGLPVITEDDVFPPLSHDVVRVPVQDSTFDRDTLAQSLRNHLDIDLDIFDDDGYSLHTETSPSSDGTPHTTKWKLSLLHRDPPVLTIDNFFTPQECQAHISLVDPSSPHHDASQTLQLASPTFSSSLSRRTSTTWFAAYRAVPTLLAKAQRLFRTLPLSRCEEPQIVRYRPGEEFSWHYDQVPPSETANGGQRLATLLVYLNDAEEGAGGATAFRDLVSPGGERLRVRPAAGRALLFFPAYRDGRPDERTLHGGEPGGGVKWIAQLWVHEGEYGAGVPRGNRWEDAVERVEEERGRLGFV